MSDDLEWARKAGEVLRGRLYGDQRGSGPVVTGTADCRTKSVSTLEDLLRRTILHGEGNSLLVIGPRGCGKTWVLEQVFSSLNGDPQCKGNFIKVQLNGLIHTDDRLALLEIARQLDINEDLGEKISLSFSAALDYLLTALREGSHANQSVVFILDEFDLFTHHKNQTLLYNLFDTAQAALNPIAVVGLTCRLDAIELLEKRVKSRFSHRQINLFCDNNFEDYLKLFHSLLALPVDFVNHGYRNQWNMHLKGLVENTKVRESLRRVFDASPDVRSLKTLLMVPVCRLGLREPFLRPGDFSFSLALVQKESVSAMLCGLSILELCLVIAMKHIHDVKEDQPFNFEMVYNEYKKFTQRSHSVEFFGKPVALKLYNIIGDKLGSVPHYSGNCYCPYANLASNEHFIQDLRMERSGVGSCLMGKAFEHLVSLELVSPADTSGCPTTNPHGGKVMKEYQPMVLFLEEDQVKQAVQKYPNCPTDVQRWGASTGIV